MFDGDFYSKPAFIPGDTIVDNLIAATKIPPIVVAFIDQIDRQQELACSKEFAAFVATELVRIRTERRVAPCRTNHGWRRVAGRLDGVVLAPEHPGVFGNVISQSRDQHRRNWSTGHHRCL